jgi:hypothetical protein
VRLLLIAIGLVDIVLDVNAMRTIRDDASNLSARVACVSKGIELMISGDFAKEIVNLP